MEKAVRKVTAFNAHRRHTISEVPGWGWTTGRKMCCGEDFSQELEAEGDSTHPESSIPIPAPPTPTIPEEPAAPSQYATMGRSDQNFPPKVCEGLLAMLNKRDWLIAQRRGDGGGAPAPATTLVAAPVDELVALNRRLWALASDPLTAQFCRARLELLGKRFECYVLEARDEEMQEQRHSASGRSFLTVPKVDTHLHASALMTAGQLADFMQAKYKADGERELRDGVTVGKEMRDAGFKPDRFDGDALEVEGSYLMFQNFDAFNQAFSPLGSRAMKSLFMGTDALGGEYLREALKICCDVAKKASGFLEPRFSVYGRKRDEWAKLARWCRAQKVDEISNCLLAVQLPRVYPVWRGKGDVLSFGDFLRNFWEPLFEALGGDDAPEPGSALDDIAWLAARVRVLDTVDDESVADVHDIAGLPAPDAWTSDSNPPYSYYHYYMHANLTRLAAVVRARGRLPAFDVRLRPHGGEAGPEHHLASAFLFCDGISHGINLDHNPVLQYLYYLAAVPIGVSPISNSVLFLKYADSPFPRLFRRGLNVALTTDDPLMFHTTPTPLLEEYATARHAFGLSAPDLCEIARNSCLAAFSPAERVALYGSDAVSTGSNVPRCRLAYRKQRLDGEWAAIRAAAATAPSAAAGGV